MHVWSFIHGAASKFAIVDELASEHQSDVLNGVNRVPVKQEHVHLTAIGQAPCFFENSYH